ncbi:DUF1345 domain-containing protein [Pararhizobium sp.]|uniref:DUF1345 domain-containing protein n=1 Tax=Pararhizobium sp. TaxID=1977563 RepID=UPI002724BDEC|nr:DUF1345 domain-containing protein [Pararhizobium sp.]MDO9418883.1 DUF1345 domain-containing protein [Pararhizobium sp.]
MSGKTTLHHKPFYFAAVSGVAALLASLWIVPPLAIEIAAITFFVLYLALTGLKIRHLTAHDLKHRATDTDEPVAIIFAVTLGTVVLSIASLFVLVNSSTPVSGLQIALSLGSVALGWLTVHTMAALHYAHVYWLARGRRETSPDAGDKPAGLDFPSTPDPGVFDFLYFSFVIGMTAQTSDVAITTTTMRKLNLAHAIVSYFFNTVLVAAVVNIAVSLPG